MEKGKEKLFISRDVVFDESKMAIQNTDAAVNVQGSTVFELELETSPLNNSNHLNQDENLEHGGVTSEHGESSESLLDVPGQSSSESEDVEATKVISTENLESYQLARDQVRREIRPPPRYASANIVEYALNSEASQVNNEPLTYKEALNSTNRVEWENAMLEEMDSLYKNNTWILVDKPVNQKLVGCKWIYRLKHGANENEPIRYKDRLVAKGFTQTEGIDYEEIFSPVVRHTSIRILLSLTVAYDFELEQLDVKTAFLHGDLDETIYMQQPVGFVSRNEQSKVCLLKKSLYGLKQSPRQWYLRFDSFILSCGFSRSKLDHCVYLKHTVCKSPIYLLLYVDDMLLASKSMSEINKLKNQLSSEFDMKDMGNARRILGIDIIRNRDKGTLKLSQEKYSTKMLSRFNMLNCKGVSVPLAKHFKLSLSQSPKTDEEAEKMLNIPYSNAVGSLMYLMVCTRPDLAHRMSVVSRYMSNPGREHWQAVKWILRYVKTTVAYGLLYTQSDNQSSHLLGYVDADYAADCDKRRSLTGYVFPYFGNLVSWRTFLQSVVALSTTESEYIAATDAIKEAIWLRELTNELVSNDSIVVVYCDSQSVVYLSKNQTFHNRTKHIDIRYHFLRKVMSEGQFVLKKISSFENAADAFTKALPLGKLESCLSTLKICSV